jgi:hypothetical protein
VLIGEVYVSNQNSWDGGGGCILVILQPFGTLKEEMVECLVLLDEHNTSMYGPGTTDEWTVDQLQRLFTRIL